MSFVRYEAITYNADGYEESRDYIGGSETQEGITRYFGPDWADLGKRAEVGSLIRLPWLKTGMVI